VNVIRSYIQGIKNPNTIKRQGCVLSRKEVDAPIPLLSQIYENPSAIFGIYFPKRRGRDDESQI